jgi:hypothetical protein
MRRIAMRQGKFWALLVSALLFGLLLAWVDTRPGWDDTGLMVGVIFLVTLFLGVVMPEHAWLWALAVGGWIPLVEISRSGNFGALLALVAAFAGAYTGAFVRRAFSAVG